MWQVNSMLGVSFEPQTLHFFFFFFWHNLKPIQLQGKKTKQNTLGETASQGYSRIMPIRGLTFQVITKLLQVTMRPLTYQTSPNSLSASS